MRTAGMVLGVVAVTVVASSGCSAGGNPGSGDDTVTIAIAEDPGNLDPHQTTMSSAYELARFAYDSLIHVDDDGKTVAGLAKSWKQSGNSYTFTLKDGVTCADGSPITAEVVADNLKYAADPKNSSPLGGMAVPHKMGVTADAKAGTVTTTTTEPVAFFLAGMATVPIVCESGLGDRKVLKKKTHGSGPYVLAKVQPNDRYTYELRDGYRWGPDGRATGKSGMPKKVVFRVVENEATAANLLLSGDLDISAVAGPDRDRLRGQDLFRHDVQNIDGEMFYNQQPGRPGSDERVRRALTMALDLGKVGKVLTGGQSREATGMVTLEPRVCTENTVSGNLPGHDVSGAKALLDEAGWKVGKGGVREKDGKSLSLELLYHAAQPNLATAVELAVEQWEAVGAEVKQRAKTDAQVSDILFKTGSWDITWNSLQAQLPSQLVPYLSGPTPKDGGTNFAYIDNAEYEANTAKANTLPGEKGCDHWKQAEVSLIQHVDAVPYIGKSYPFWGRGIKFESTAFGITPTSLKKTD